MAAKDTPKQVRIRTDPDEGLGHRYDAIDAAASRLGVNKTRAVVASCDAVGNLLDNIEAALRHEDVPPKVARELASEMSTRYIKVRYSGPEVRVDVD